MADEIIRFLPLVSAASLAETEPPKIHHVDGHGWFPQEELSFLSGAGGSGKTTLAMQLGAAVASTGEVAYWLDRPVELRGGVLFYSAEENLASLHRKLFDIAASDPSIDIRRHLARLQLLDFSVDRDKWLLTVQRGRVIRTPTFGWLETAIKRNDIKLLILDNRAQISLIDEIKRNDATALVNEFRELALTYGVAIILLQHPSLSGMRTNGGSGSTGFVNVARNFVFMLRPDGSDIDPDQPEDDGRRILRGTKVNAGKTGRITNLQWTAGIYRCTDKPPPRAGSDIGKPERAERLFLELLEWHNERGINTSMSTTALNYAPKKFVAHPDTDRSIFSLKDLEKAMHALDRAVKIRSVPYGPPSDKTYRLEVVKCNL